jgi:bifunctional non-homologous end joining protein LigD
MRNGKPKRKTTLCFVIHEHQSSHHHFDFRLEMDGVLKSWAVPKGPSMNPAEKRLAIAVSDHPLSYGRYQGIIPEGTYGAGPVVIWDAGVYKPCEAGEPREQLQDGRLTFELDGDKLRGKFMLRRYPQRHNQWLLIKLADEYAQPKWAIKTELTSDRLKRLRVRKPKCHAA